MSRLPRTAAALGAALLVAGAALAPAFAQPGPGGRGGPGRGPAAMFVEIDTDKDGRVTWEEVWVFVQQRFGQADTDRSGGLSEAELLAAAPARGGPPGDRGGPQNDRGPRGERRAEMAGAMFRALDANRDGQVTLEEVRPAIEARFRAADANGDNAVAKDELPRGHGRGGPAAPANPG